MSWCHLLVAYTVYVGNCCLCPNRFALPTFKMAPSDLLLQLKVASIGGQLNLDRAIIVNPSMPVHQLHRVIQFCLNAANDDASIEAKVCEHPFPCYVVAVCHA